MKMDVHTWTGCCISDLHAMLSDLFWLDDAAVFWSAFDFCLIMHV
jgi:hypothetical protein